MNAGENVLLSLLSYCLPKHGVKMTCCKVMAFEYSFLLLPSTITVRQPREKVVFEGRVRDIDR